MSFYQDRLTIVGVDDGYDHTKVVSGSSVACIPTSFSHEETVRSDTALGDAESHERVYEVNGKRVVVGERLENKDTRFEEFPFDEANLAVSMDAIRRVVAPGTQILAVCGLPMSRFYLPNGSANPNIIPRKQHAWSRSVKCIKGYDSALPQICQIEMQPEAVAAWYDYVIDDEMDMLESAYDFMAVVDIGGRTTDIAVFEDTKVRGDLSGTMDSGMLKIQQSVKDFLAAHPDPEIAGTKFTRDYIARGVESGMIKLGNGQPIDVTEAVSRTRSDLITQIDGFIKTKLSGRMALLRRILFVGGGASALKLSLREIYKNRAEFVVDPQMSNARGLYKYGMTQRKHRETQIAI